MDGVPVVIEFDGKEKYEWIEEEPVDSAAKHWQEKVRRERIEELCGGEHLLVHARQSRRSGSGGRGPIEDA